MINNPKISVILPTFNVGQHIARALESLKKQSFQNFEVIIVDDCGHDNSIEVAEGYAKNDERIKIIKNPKNLGTYHARRVGVEHSLGDYIVFLDPDDELDSDVLLQIQLKIDEEKKDIIFFGVAPSVKGRWHDRPPYMFPVNQTQSLLVSYFANGTRSYLWGTPGKSYKASFIKNLYRILNVSIDFRFVYAEDVFLLIHAMLLRPNYSCVFYNGYIYHNNETSITQSNLNENDTRFLQYDFMIDSLKEHANEIDLSKDEKNTFNFVKKKLYADRFLLLRHSNSSNNYLKYLVMSFKLLPNIAKASKITAFILSLGHIKL